MSNIKRMKDKDGNYIYPVTHEDAVFDSEGISIGEKINDTISNGLAQVMAEVNKIEPSTAEVRYIAHRGYSAVAPENTIPAYEKAGEALYWGAECDIQETSDGEFVLMHDTTVDRTTDGTGEVSSMTLAQIKELTVDAGASISSYPDLKVPTLKEYLICCKKYGMNPIIEVKSINNMEGFINTIREMGMIDQSIIISFDNATLESIRAYNKDIRIQTLTYKSIEHCIANNFDVDIYYDSSMLSDLIPLCHNAEIKVNVWTVNDIDKETELIELGVDYITTDKLKSVKSNTFNDINNQVSVLEEYIFTIFEKSVLQDGNYMTLSSEFHPTEYSDGVYFEDRFPTLSADGTATRMSSQLISTMKLEQLFVYNTVFMSSNLAIHGYDSSKKHILDSGYIGFNTLFDIPSDVKYITLYVTHNGVTEDVINTANDNLELYVGHELQDILDDKISNSLPESVVIQYDYEIIATADDLINATPGVTESTSFPNTYKPVETETSKAVYPYLFDGKDVKFTVDFDRTNYKISMHAYSIIGGLVKDTGWNTEGQTYDISAVSGARYWALIFGTVDNSAFDSTRKQELLDSITITIIE